MGLFCSTKCFGVWETGARNPSPHTGNRTTKACGVCGAEFTVHSSIQHRHSTCSAACKSQWLSASAKSRGMYITKPCGRCGKELRLPPARGSNTRFCGKTCKNAAHAELMSGKGNVRYVHGEAERLYGSGWTSALRSAIRERDGNICRHCGVTEEQNGKILCVHHIDYDKDNHTSTNLITVCKWCHGKMHGGLSQREQWRLKLSALLDESPP